jgi:hypothetical protein
VHRSSGAESGPWLGICLYFRVSGSLPGEKAIVLPRLKKPEARFFSTILG